MAYHINGKFYEGRLYYEKLKAESAQFSQYFPDIFSFVPHLVDVPNARDP